MGPPLLLPVLSQLKHFPHFVSDFYAFLFLLTVSQREIVSTCGLVLGDERGMWVVLLKM